MTVSAGQFRHVLGRLAGGVCVIAARGPDGRPRGLTATAVCSVSLEPPLILVCVGSDSNTHDAIQGSGFFTVTFLAAGDTAIADRFAADDEHKFDELPIRTAATGAPVLDAGLAYCDCTLVNAVPAGDHSVFIGRVESAELSAAHGGRTRRPLLHYRGTYLSGPEGEGPADEAP